MGLSSNSMFAEADVQPLPVESRCPWCDQSIPHEKFDEIHALIEAKERERLAEEERKLHQQLEQQKIQVEARARADVESAKKAAQQSEQKLRLEFAAKEIAARDEAAKVARELLERETKKVREDAAAREAAVRQEAERARQEGEAAKGAAAEALRKAKEDADNQQAALERARQDAEAMRRANAEALERAKRESVAREAAAREEAKKAAQAELATEAAAAQQERDAARQEREAAKQDREAAKLELDAAKAAHEAELTSRLAEQRAALEKAKLDELNAERAKGFEQKIKLEGQLQEMTRQLQEKTAQELGEGAEVNLFEALKVEFPEDRITRIEKGAPGADIRHHVVHNGNICGVVLYDSKNRSAWRNDYVTKLKADQIADKADHAVLSTSVFPAGTKQLHIQEGVILANPARIVALVHVLRRQIVHVHALRLSNEARAHKTEQLYEFITSERSSTLFEQMSTIADSLLELDVKETKAHEQTWRRRGELIRSSQRAQAAFETEIERIIGTARAEGIQ